MAAPRVRAGLVVETKKQKKGREVFRTSDKLSPVFFQTRRLGCDMGPLGSQSPSLSAEDDVLWCFDPSACARGLVRVVHPSMIALKVAVARSACE